MLMNCSTCRNVKNCSKVDIARGMACMDYKERRGMKNVETNNKTKKRTWKF